MQVTICIDGEWLFFGRQDDDGFRGGFGRQRDAMPAAAGFDVYPFDEVFGCHGVRHATDADIDSPSAFFFFDLNDGEVFFFARIDGIGDELCHGLATTDGHDARGMNYADEVVAMFAVIESICHGSSPRGGFCSRGAPCATKANP